VKKGLAYVFIAAVWVGASALTGTACWFQATLGLPCPGCGSIRAGLALCRGDLAGALGWHPLIFVSLAGLLAAALSGIVYKISGKRVVRSKKAVTAVLWGVFFLYVGVFAVRMVLYFPHTQPLVPYEGALWRVSLRWASDLINRWRG